MSADPPGNHRGTTAAQRHEARPAAGVAVNARIGEFFTALGDAWRLTDAQRTRLAPNVKAALHAGWTPQALASVTGVNTSGVRNPYAGIQRDVYPSERQGHRPFAVAV